MKAKRVDTKEFELPDTVYVRDIDNRVLQGIVLQCLANISGISPIEGNFIDNILGRTEGIKGIDVEQDPKNHSISIKVEVNIAYGIPIPAKAEEIQSKVTEEITKITGLHVALVHVIFKGLIAHDFTKKMPSNTFEKEKARAAKIAVEYSDIF